MAETTQDPPPTTQNMTPTHRLRVMRSMRKISALLGETAVLEASKPELLVPADKSGFFHGPVSLPLFLPFQSAQAQPHQRRALSADERPALSLRLPEIDADGASDPLLSPSSPTSPVSGTEQDPALARRNRMAKLTRTLGETIPAALILPTVTSSSAPVKRRRRASTLIVPESELEQQAFAARAARDAAVALTPLALPSRAASAMEMRTEGDCTNEAASPSASSLAEVHLHPRISLSPDTPVSPREWIQIRPASRASSLARTPTTSREMSTERREATWTGEWAGAAGDSMYDVVHSLRRLRSSK